ncbi:HAMP domain-containing protein [Micromonospora sp. NPDC049679]|uniref:cache domain-containing protein n=1 Tax=Micromonospora sp. NPDC049679 TaxID=3155920 RepID=UPI0033DCBFEB
MKREGRPAQHARDRQTDQLSHEQVVASRRRALDQQLPTAAFPAGSGKPSLVYLWATMFLAAVMVLGFALNHERGVPPAVVDSQRDNVSKLAAGIELPSEHSIEDLDRLVAAGVAAMTPDAELLNQVVGDASTWSGAAIVETSTRRPLAALGPAVPFELLPPALPVNATFPIVTADGPSMVRSTTLDASRTLLAMQPLDIGTPRLNSDARQGIFVIAPDGKSTLMQGVSAVDEVHLPVVFRGLAQSESRDSHPITVTEWPDQQLVVSSAPVGDTGLTVASLIVADVTGGTSTTRGAVLGLILLAMAGLSFLLMRVSLVGPVRALLNYVKGDACGAVTKKRQRLRVAEAHRIVRALAVTSGDPSAPAARRMRWRPTVTQGLAAATVVALLWPAAAVATTLAASGPSVPDQLVKDEESRAEAASTALGKALDNGLQRVTRIAGSPDVTDRAGATAALDREFADQRRFRGLYLVNPSGSVVSSAGREPLRAAKPLSGEGGIGLDDHTSRLPVVYAFRPVANGFALVGEFDIDYLLGRMRQDHGRVRVVDSDLRTVLDSEGFRAFQALQGGARQAATEALTGATVGRAKTPGGDPALLAAAGLSAPNTVAHLKWSVVVEQDLAGLLLPESFSRRWTLLIAGIAAGIVLLIQVWHFYVFARPLRQLAGEADRIRTGSFDVPIPPQRHDDVGAVAMCLEICRQVRHTGPDRLGGASRMGGTGENCAVCPRLQERIGPGRAEGSPRD